MRVGMFLNYAGGFREVADEVAELEASGVDLVAVPEAYSFDAVSQLGFLAARTSRMTLMSGILQLYTRTPTLTAMTAAGLDYVSDGRFELGVGASGPQVVEGFHGVRTTRRSARIRELIEVCRQVWRREPVVHDGRHYRIPLPAGQGTGLGKPLKLINHPCASGSRSPSPPSAEVGRADRRDRRRLAADVLPPRARRRGLGRRVAAGAAKRPSDLAPLDVFASPALAITDRPEAVLPLVKPQLALYVGGMGARGKNFYTDLIASYGFEAEAARVQDLYLEGRRDEAIAAVPDELVRAISLIGPASYVAERVAAFRDAGVTTLAVTPLARDSAERVALMAGFRRLVG
jgi:F420-dependent oxidoreductase-like protein